MSPTHKVVIWRDYYLETWVANCQCGWASSKRETKEAATRDGEGHYGGRIAC